MGFCAQCCLSLGQILKICVSNITVIDFLKILHFHTHFAFSVHFMSIEKWVEHHDMWWQNPDELKWFEINNIFILVISMILKRWKWFYMIACDISLFCFYLNLQHISCLIWNYQNFLLCQNFQNLALRRHFLLTLHNYIYFMNGKSVWMQMKILEYIAVQIYGLVHNIILDIWRFFCNCYFDAIWLFFCCYQDVNIFFSGIPVHSRVNLVHFKGAQLDPDETYIMKLTYWSLWTQDCLLEHKMHMKQIISLRIVQLIYMLKYFRRICKWSLSFQPMF